MRHPFCHRLARVASAVLALLSVAALRAQGTITLQLQDYALAPITGLNNTSENSVYLARVNFLREEPGASLNRFFVCDLNGKLYILDKTTRLFTTYLDFNRNTTETAGANGLFAAFTRALGYANGLVTFQFDPEYGVVGSPNYGKFYTAHVESDLDNGVSRLPNASAFPGFTNAATYTTTGVNESPGFDSNLTRQGVLIEWQDTNPTNTTFEGTARELLRIEFNNRFHPIGDLQFNPLATGPAHPDWRKLYVTVGEGGAGEVNDAALHAAPQRLDLLQGKILRILPDAPGGGTLRYTIPADNPFVGSTLSPIPRPEIYAYGFRNPHRISFDPPTGLLLETDVGLHTWEEVNLIRRGANYGYADREGTGVLNVATGLATSLLPADDAAKNYIYPVIEYTHSAALGVGDAICGGFVYRGTKIPQLQGKFIFGDITTGELFYADLAAMIAADDGNPATLAPYYHLEIEWANPRASVVAGTVVRYDRMYEIVADTYHARGGPLNTLPGSATVSNLTGGGRADIRLAVDNAGELYILSKSDGMIRYVDGVATPTAAPVISKQPAAQTIAAGNTVAFTVEASGASTYQWRRNGAAISGAINATYTLTNAAAADAGSYTVEVINAAGTTTSSAAALTVSASADPGHLVNLSIRSTAGTGAQTLIVGFVLDGASGVSFDRELLMRGVGPSLAQFGVTGFLPDPKIALYRDTALLAFADNWFEPNPGSLDGISPRFGAFTLVTSAPDAVLTQNALPRGAYSVQITSAVAGQSGAALAEIYDTPGAATGLRQLVNVSARTTAGPSNNTLIAGFVIGGATARTVLVRAAGPVLTTFNVTGVLADPKLALYRGSEKLAESDNWQTSADLVNTFASVGAFNFNARSKDAVLYLTLAPGEYTAQVSGATTGVALVEVYVLP